MKSAPDGACVAVVQVARTETETGGQCARAPLSVRQRAHKRPATSKNGHTGERRQEEARTTGSHTRPYLHTPVSSGLLFVSRPLVRHFRIGVENRARLGRLSARSWLACQSAKQSAGDSPKLEASRQRQRDAHSREVNTGQVGAQSGG